MSLTPKKHDVEDTEDMLDIKSMLKLPAPKLQNLDSTMQRIFKSLQKQNLKPKKQDMINAFTCLRHYPIRPANGGRHPDGEMILEEETIDLLSSGPCAKTMFGSDTTCGRKAVKRLKQRNLGIMYISTWDGEFYDSLNSLDTYILLCYWSQKYQFYSKRIPTPDLRHNVSEYLVMITPE